MASAGVRIVKESQGVTVSMPAAANTEFKKHKRHKKKNENLSILKLPFLCSLCSLWIYRPNINSGHIRGSRTKNLLFPRQHAAPVCVVHGNDCAGFLADTRDGRVCRNAPGIEINRVTDIALKGNRVVPGMQVVERQFGMLEIHSESQAEIRQAGAAILDALELKEEDRIKPTIVSSQIIRNVDDHQTQLINRMRHGNMLLAGQTLYIMECEPAGYAALAANEAEKASNVNLLEVRAVGSRLLVPLGGEERDIEVGHRAALRDRRRFWQTGEATLIPIHLSSPGV
jgi:hypothetical protein